MSETNSLHLPSLSIEGFRCIDSLSITRLGRVTLLTGRNSIGKTTVLDAVKVYAELGELSALRGLLRSRDEYFTSTVDDGRRLPLPDYRALFHNRYDSDNARISIGTGKAEQLTIKPSISTDSQLNVRAINFNNPYLQGLDFKFRGNQEEEISWTIPFDIGSTHDYYRTAVTRRTNNQDFIRKEDEPPINIKCKLIETELPNNRELAGLWYNVALTDDETQAVDAIQLILGTDAKRVAAIGDVNTGYPGRDGPRVIVQVKGIGNRVPLRSLGDGVVRLFCVALALVYCRDGLLLIDEAENSIHYSLHRKYWDMVFRAAHKYNIQVLATTHSWECIKGFAQAASDLNDTEGMLVRLSRQYGYLRAVEYPEEGVKIAAEQRIEVR